MGKKKTSIFENLSPAMDHPPSDIQHITGFFNAEDGTDLFWHTWASEKPKGLVTLVHGFGEYAARYHHFASALARAGFAVFAFDCRGHGRSGGKRAFIQKFSKFVSDLELAVKESKTHFPDLPQHIFGHSNGGLIAVYHASTSKQAEEISSYVFTSPFLGFKLEVPAAKAMAGNLLSKIYPSVALPTDLDAKWITRSENVVKKYREDPLVLKIATARWFTETKKAQAELVELVDEFTCPSFWLVAQSDEIASASASERIFAATHSKGGRIELLPEHFHEVLNEPDWEKHAQNIIDWYGEHQ